MWNTSGFLRRLVATGLLCTAAFTVLQEESRAQTSAAEMDQIDAALREADKMESQGKPQDAIKLMEKTLARTRRSLAADDPARAAVLNSLGAAYAHGGRHKDAEPLFREALKIARAHPTETGTLRLSSLNNLVEVLWKAAKYVEALPLCEESLKGVEEALGPDDWRTNMARDTLAKVYLSAKRPADAIPVSRQALRHAESRFKADDPQTIPFRNTLSTALLQAGQYPEAEKLFKVSMAIAKKRLPPEHEFTTATVNGLAGVYQLTDRNAEAAALAAGAVKGVEDRPGSDASDDAVVVNNRGTSLMQAGRFAEAEHHFLHALELSEKSLGADHPESALVLANLAHLYTRWARFADAERYARRSLDLISRNPGPGTVAEAKGKLGLAAIYVMTGRYDDAEPLLKAAHTTLQDRLEPGHPDTLYALHNLCGLYSATNRYDLAVSYGESALADLQKRLSPESSYSAILLLNLGQSYIGLGRLDEAEDRLVRAVTIFTKLGRVTSESAAAENALAGLCLIKGKTGQAESLYRRAVASCEKWHGADHPDTTNALDNLATFQACQGNWGPAADLFDKTRRLRRSFLARTLPALSEDDQISLISMAEQTSRDGALSLALQRRADPGVAARSAEWAFNSKAVALQALAERAVLSHDVQNPEAARLLADRETTRGRLAMLALRAEEPGKESSATNNQYDELVKREQELSRQLGLALRSPSTVTPWAELREVRAALPPDAVLVEFARVRVMEYALEVSKMGWRPARYVAWVIPPAGGEEVSIVDLGPADAIDRAVSDVLKALQPDPDHPIEAHNEPSAEREVRVVLGALSKLVLAPLGPQLDHGRRWVMSPDSALWLVPWAALTVGEGRYAVEDHLIYLTTSGRDLLAPETTGTTTKPAILADPDYDLSPDKVLAKAHELGRVRSATESGHTPPLNSRPGSLPGTIDRLAGFKDEAEAVAPLMKAYAGLDPDVYLEAAASETVFKNLRGPKALLISTHGFFLSGPMPADDTPPLSPGPLRRAARTGGDPANPLLRCSLALAGYNCRPSSPSPGDLDDGLLTGLEVVGVDLRGTDLVVLSACKTAVGEIRDGEGVAGLRRAFQLAGAGAVVASLWNVQDQETYQLISAFFQGLARRRGSASALREAQLAMIADRRSRLGAAHPSFWAAFSLTGFPGAAWRDEPLADPQSPDLPRLPQYPPRAGLASHPASSPVTGRPDVGGPWSDVPLAILLLSGGVYAARLWWRIGGKGSS